MEGRISRESMGRSEAARPAASPSRERARYYSHSGGRSSRARYAGRGSGKKPGAIPEGRDMFIVQLLASGVLLVFVMFVAIVDSEGTNSMKEKLGHAFSKTTSIAEVTGGFSGVRDRLSGGADVVLEIFGKEVEEDDAVNLIEIQDEPQAGAEAAEAVGSVIIEPELLEEINGYSEDFQKN